MKKMTTPVSRRAQDRKCDKKNPFMSDASPRHSCARVFEGGGALLSSLVTSAPRVSRVAGFSLAMPVPKRASRQATLHQLGKVVTSRSSSYYNVSVEDVLRHKKTLEDREHTTRAEFVEALRQLSSMTLTHEVLSESLIGQVVNRVARKHPDPELREMGASIVKKWKAEVVARERRKKQQGWTRAGGGASSARGGVGGSSRGGE